VIMMFRRTRWRPDKKQPTIRLQDVRAGFAPLREAADVEMPADSMDRRHRARLLLELVDAINHPDPDVARELQQEPVRDSAPPPRQRPAIPEQRQRSPQRGGRHRAASRRSQTLSGSVVADERHRVHKRAKPTIIASFAAVVVAIVVTVVALRPAEQSSWQDGALGVTALGHVQLRVGVLPVVDVAPFYRAVEAGYFAQEGLEVEVAPVQSGPQAIADLVAGGLDVAFGRYPAILQAQSDRKENLQIIAPAYTALPGHLMLVAPPNGGIQQPRDVDGKRIAVTGTGSISDLGVKSQLKNIGAGFGAIQWVPMSMPDMGPAMQRGDVDGAVLAEPYITVTDKAFHARPILDVAIAGTARLPVSGWATYAKLSQTHPEVVAGFVRALQRGIDDVSERSTLDPLLVRNLGISAEEAKDVRIAEYTKKLNPAEIQRVADLMKEFNVIHQPLDVRPMLLP
jgi:NitT/TauT family transport system substrate-binding protein